MTQKQLRKQARETLAALMKETNGAPGERLTAAIQALHAPERKGE